MKALIAALSLFFTLMVNAQEYRIDRLEPEFWWAGMKHPELQLMVYGPNVSELKPRVNYPGVRIRQLLSLENPNYLLIYLQLSPKVKPGQVSLEFYRQGKKVLSREYALLARQPGSADRQGFSAKDAIYLITPDRFANGNPNNDAVDHLTEKPNRAEPGGRHGGDIAGMRQHLDYIAEMGFTQIWANPLLENNQPEYSYHGYSITDFYRIDDRFGSNQEYRDFVADAKARNMGVIQDVVLNHIGSEHWWLKDMPAKDWLNSTEFYSETNHARTTVHDLYASDYDRRKFAQGWFVKTMPDLNQRNPHLAEYLIQHSIWWVEFAGLSGLRVDTYGYSDKDFLSNWSRRVMHEYPRLNLVGEEWSSSPSVVAYWQAGKKNADGYRSHAPSMMDFPLREALLNGLTQGTSWQGGLTTTYETLAHDYLYADPYNLVIFEGNHDLPRLYSLLGEDYGRYQLAMIYIATMRGIPQFFYGTEILMTSPIERDDGRVRADFPGGWPGDKVNGFTGKGLSPEAARAQSRVKSLLNWRKGARAIHQGKLMHFFPEQGVYVYFRYLDKEKYMIVLNPADKAVSLELAPFAEMLGSASTAQDVLTGQVFALDEALPLSATQGLILAVE
jgi:glycosidase